MAQIEALHFCYLTISLKGFRKTPCNLLREKRSTGDNTESFKRNEAVLQCPELGLLLLLLLLLLAPPLQAALNRSYY